MFNYFKKFFLIFSCIGILPSAYAMDGYISRGISTLIVGSKKFIQAPFSYLYNQMNKYNYTLPGSVRHIIETNDFSEENSQVIQRYLDRGYSPNIAIGKNRTTPLVFAAKHGNFNLVEFLLAKNADVNVSNKFGETPFSLVTKHILQEKDNNTQKRKNNYLEQLLNRGAIPNSEIIADGETALTGAILKGNFELVDLLLTKKWINVDICNKRGETPFSIITNNILEEQDNQKQKIYYKILNQLLEHGAKIDEKEYCIPALTKAVIRQNLQLVDFLLKNRANANVSSEKKRAMCYLDYFFLKNGQQHINVYNDINNIPKEQKVTAPYILITNIIREKDDQKQKTNYIMLEKLLQNGAKLDFLINDNGLFDEVPLIIAIENQNIAFIDLLLKYINTNGIDINACNKKRNSPFSTALKIALKTNDLKIVEKLLKYKANANIRIGCNKKTALILAIESQNLEMIELLLQNKAGVNIADEDENTPLLIALKTALETRLCEQI